MKKLAILSAVAALAAFGWADVADAADFGETNPTCTQVVGATGLSDNSFNVTYGDLGQFETAVMLACMDPEKGRAKTTSFIDDDFAENVPLTDFNGWRSLRDGDVCVITAKGLHEEGPNNSTVDSADCNTPLDDS